MLWWIGLAVVIVVAAVVLLAAGAALGMLGYQVLDEFAKEERARKLMEQNRVGQEMAARLAEGSL